MDVREAIRRRRSVRHFKTQDVPSRLVEEMIDSACWAPSAGNIQPWEFVVVRKAEIKRELAEAALYQDFIEEVPVVIVACADEDRCSLRYGSRGKNLYCIQDTAAAIQNMHLTAYSRGLGTCWVGAFKEEEARAILKIPKGIRPVAIIAVGYPAKTPAMRKKRPFSETMHLETF